jgi:plasmid stability protein
MSLFITASIVVICIIDIITVQLMTQARKTTLVLPEDLASALKMRAAGERRSMSSLVSEFCQIGLQAREGDHTARLTAFKKAARYV